VPQKQRNPHPERDEEQPTQPLERSEQPPAREQSDRIEKLLEELKRDDDADELEREAEELRRRREKNAE
jgi:hypothetical protein